MDRQSPVTVPESLRYRDGLYKLERFPRAGAVTSIREKRRFTRPLRAIHRLWFAVWMPKNVAALITTGRKSGEPRASFVRAYRECDKVYLVSITGEHALWLKNIRANPEVALHFRQDRLTGTSTAQDYQPTPRSSSCTKLGSRAERR
ncbi:nitroreductase family deazaflavin-dependent oxidoreductase [Mycobacterium sp. 1245852.3]|uniref:nitroreductase family deazaflavin-dependent oxidoreductase n=1 Tax=Mycobacterium sp. 1245852.3 TaxID=1856860 RepID=UPI0009EDAAFF|nr:nitroreductase family deazaflavin-dependent oxidoreductase [Mycobacterium sp. 1245852.3]